MRMEMEKANNHRSSDKTVITRISYRHPQRCWPLPASAHRTAIFGIFPARHKKHTSLPQSGALSASEKPDLQQKDETPRITGEFFRVTAI